MKLLAVEEGHVLQCPIAGDSTDALSLPTIEAATARAIHYRQGQVKTQQCRLQLLVHN